MPRGERNQPKVLYVSDERSRNESRIIHKALAELENNLQIQFFEKSSDEVKANSDNIDHINPDAVIAPTWLHHLIIEHLDRRCALFNLDGIFEKDDAYFVEIPGVGTSSMDPKGEFGGFPRFPKWGGGKDNKDNKGGKFPENIFEAVDELLGLTNSPPKGHLGGGVAGFLKDAVDVIDKVIRGAKDALEYLAEKSDKMVKEQIIIPKEKLDKRIDDLAQKYKEELKPRKKQQESDASGFDFLLALRLWYGKVLVDQIWKEICSGIIRPEATGVRKEFVDWLKVNGFVEEADPGYQALLHGKPLPEDDDTPYSLAYWMWKATCGTDAESSKVLQYLLRKGAPIDPISQQPSEGKIFYLGCQKEADGLKLTFLGPELTN